MKKLSEAIALTQNKDFKKAEALYLELLTQDTENAILLSFAGLFYSNTKEFEKAEKYLQKAYEISKSTATISALGFMEYERKDFEKSAKYLEEALQYGDSEDVHNKLILSLFNIRNYPKAIEYSGCSLKYSTTSFSASSNLPICVRAFTICDTAQELSGYF